MLTERLNFKQLEQIEEYKDKYPMLGEIITTGLKKGFIVDLTIKEAGEITDALGKKLGDIWDVFKPLEL